MAKLVDGGKRTEYENYQEYVNIQDSRFHDYDCPNCLSLNVNNIAEIRNRGIKFSNLLDIGCRDFAWADQLTKEGIVCKGIDISPRSVEYARSMGRDVTLGDAVNLSTLFSDKFDLILSNHNLEHLLEPKKVLEECFKVISENGRMLIKCPNEGNKIKDTKTFAHVRTFTDTELTEMVTSVGFVIEHFEITSSNEFFLILKKNA